MKRSGNLWPQITSWENLLRSALAAARGERKRPDVARFLADLEPNLCSLETAWCIRLVPLITSGYEEGFKATNSKDNIRPPERHPSGAVGR